MVATFAPDSTLWTIGHLKDDGNTRVIAEYVLRRFDSAGKMLGSITLKMMGWQSAAGSFLRASDDRVGWLTPQRQYVEFSLDGSEIARYHGPDRTELKNITGLAISAENDVIAGRFGRGKAEFVALDRERRACTAVWLAKDSAPTWAWVLGYDGTTLVTYSNSGSLRRFSTN